MIKRWRIWVIFYYLPIFLLLWEGSAKAQSPVDQWSPPYRLSNGQVQAHDGYVVADPYGYVHAVWSESESADYNHMLIQYSRFDGQNWSKPIDIQIGDLIGDMAIDVDRHGILHLVWTTSQTGPAFYSIAPAYKAISAQNWSGPIRLDIPAHRIGLQVDSNDIVHILYSKFREPTPGIYYIRSEDQGQTWTEPFWLDPDIPLDYTPNSLSFKLDKVSDELHAVWQYNDFANDFVGADIRYAHSLDGGISWSEPITIDEPDEEPNELRAGSPVMAVYNKEVHIIWAGTSDTHREHRFSTDGGLTWSAPIRIFGDLQGQAFDSMVVDAAGRAHFFGQIRYPRAIYHAYWDQNHWSIPNPIYRLEGDSFLHAHFIDSAVRAGNQPVIIFTDEDDPQKNLYTIYGTMNDIVPLTTLPTPTPIPTLTPIPKPSPIPYLPTPSPIPTRPQFNSDVTPLPDDTPGPGGPFWFAVIPVLLLTVGTIASQLLKKR